MFLQTEGLNKEKLIFVVFTKTPENFRYRYRTVPVHGLAFRLLNNRSVLGGLNQCCGAGAGGAEIILGPGAGAENKF